MMSWANLPEEMAGLMIYRGWLISLRMGQVSDEIMGQVADLRDREFIYPRRGQVADLPEDWVCGSLMGQVTHLCGRCLIYLGMGQVASLWGRWRIYWVGG
jgi:hypothetical protein